MPTDKQTRLQELQNKYVRQLPDKLDAINTAWQQARFGGDSSLLTQLRQLAHNLAGSAGTFGFPDVSVEARKLEEIIKNINLDDNINGETSEIISDAIQRIVGLIELGPSHSDKAISGSQASANDTHFDHLIFLIEDDASLIDAIENQLRYFDYDVQTFPDARTAMTALSSRTPSAMIIDLDPLNAKSGDSAFPELLNNSSQPRIPTIFLSDSDSWQSRLAAVKSNGRAYLPKPIDFNDILEHLDQLTLRQKPEPYKILIVDDMEVLAEYYATVLRNADMDVKTIFDMDNLLEALSDYQPDLILMDIYMPQCSGLEAAQIIRQKNELLSVPIVFLSTETNPLEHLYAMELGGDDFLQKPISDDRLVIAVRTRAERFRQLRSHMHRDGLTGLFNHATTKAQLDQEIARAQRQNEPLCFAMLDIDHFKKVNDNYGHPVGDRVIKSVARVLTKRLRKSDLIGRYGGEEFAIILPETNIETAKQLLDGIRESFTQVLHQSDKHQFTCTFSAGIAQYTTGNELDNLVSNADQALYQAKHAGRNKICTQKTQA